MRPLMYRQRPALPAFIAAGFVLVVGGLMVCGLRQHGEAGIGNPPSVLRVACCSFTIAGALVIMAFARYRFTHLWKNHHPSSAKKERGKPSRVSPKSVSMRLNDRRGRL